jgi:alkanesulfonate monooxygenase SsuD/methylene tetrahydromethanopterin reductase-like flavin-dependent oxidoreductase (luciferase family)
VRTLPGVRFSILVQHQLPRPWRPDAEHRLFGEALEQVALADRLRFDTVWAVEHHFLEEYSHASAPGVFLAACSQRTDTIRLGLGTAPLAPGSRHPAHVAEAAATLDLVSGGRVELATGETSAGGELAAFGIDRDSARAQWAETLDVVARMMVEAPFAGADGRFVTMPARNVVPKPLQKPHPPLWVTCSRRAMFRLAAEKGLGALGLAFIEPDEAEAWVDEYYEIIGSERCVPAGFAVNPNVALTLPMMVHADEAEAIARGIDGAHFTGYARGHYHAFGEHRPGRTSVSDEFRRRREDVGFARSAIGADGAPLRMKVLRQGLGSLRGAIGTPAQVAELARRYEAAGVDELILSVQTGTTELRHVLEALELFAAEVMPEFAARRTEREAAKRARIGDAAERALARRPAAPSLNLDFRFRADDDTPVTTAGSGSGAGDGAAGAPPRRRRVRPRGAALRRALEERGERALTAFVRRSDDRRLERTIGSGAGLRVVFAAMERQFVPERAAGFAGDIVYVLRAGDGRKRTWTVTLGPEKATARRGPSKDAKLTLTLALADFVRIAGRDLDPVKAVLSGRLELKGDFGVALRLGEMFGQ